MFSMMKCGLPRSSVHVRMSSSHLRDNCCSVAEASAWASSRLFCISYRRARASSSSFLSLRSCLKSLLMLCLSSSSCFSSLAAISAQLEYVSFSFGTVFTAFIPVVRENSSVESILSFSGVCRFTANFRNWRKKIRDVRKCKK